jgi:hypothetical protein
LCLWKNFKQRKSIRLSSGIDVYSDRLTEPLYSYKAIYQRHIAIKDLKIAMKKLKGASAGQERDAKIEWLTSKMEELLGLNQAQDTKDALALFELLSVPGPPENYVDRYEYEKPRF